MRQSFTFLIIATLAFLYRLAAATSLSLQPSSTLRCLEPRRRYRLSVIAIVIFNIISDIITYTPLFSLFYCCLALHALMPVCCLVYLRLFCRLLCYAMFSVELRWWCASELSMRYCAEERRASAARYEILPMSDECRVMMSVMSDERVRAR